MGHMVAQIMDLSRVRLGGGFDVSLAPVDLRAVLGGVIDELRTVHPSRTITLDCAPVTGAWDRERLEQVFSNLIGNANHHGSAETPITLTTHKEGDTISVDVHNEGDPIPEELLPTLFEPFRRGERTSQQAKTAGLGLGLYISREIVIAHGGDITVRSDAEHGTTFRVTLPLNPAQAKANPE
jgi:phosphoserine phosphatase RsbU/P